MKSCDDFLPTASLEMLRLRAELLRTVRQFFDARGYWEVETPLLSHETVIDAYLEPFAVPNPFAGETSLADERTLYLQTSPEFGMKRLLAAGAEAIYQITRAFRSDELGRLHNPEFTMVEWYRVGETPSEQMDFVEELVEAVFRKAKEFSSPASVRMQPFERLSYDEAFERFAGTRVLHLSAAELADVASSHAVAVPESFDRSNRDEWLNLLLAEIVEPKLGIEKPAFVYDYPATQAALARIRQHGEEQPVAERFELYLAGIELCNGYWELIDPEEFCRRCDEQTEIRKRENRREFRAETRLASAMRHGLPDCTGVALGFDRLMMLASGANSLDAVIAFPFDRA